MKFAHGWSLEKKKQTEFGTDVSRWMNFTKRKRKLKFLKERKCFVFPFWRKGNLRGGKLFIASVECLITHLVDQISDETCQRRKERVTRQSQFWTRRNSRWRKEAWYWWERTWFFFNDAFFLIMLKTMSLKK